ncbi:group II intron reverse transcriptase/maturase [Paenibacillus silvae]|uniref:Group II intron reverse transcriptase/maturase n=1 Tax=Paenibacillus silvae TaxID=1325358 RepID=A0ABQ1ZLA4_9BACL|nr:reverse transcriptase domain-containing protein [Paenibacillus silvae]GGH68700.1 group II intron reverse transcriptase/maturase [Paenibacillus silvae]
MARNRIKGKRLGGQITPTRKSSEKNLYDQVTSWDNLQAASKKVIANKGSYGTDGMNIKQYKANEQTYLKDIQEQLIKMEYVTSPLRTVEIPKDLTSKRLIYIPTVTDRIAQQAVLNVIEPLFEKIFLECSYGFRPSRSAHTALIRVKELADSGYQYVVKGDISRCFDTIPHKKLRRTFANIIEDANINELVNRMIAGCGGEEVRGKGVPQGSVIGPILANVYLHELDEYAETQGWKLIRYADDYLLMFKSEQEAEIAANKCRAYIEMNLGLESKNKDEVGKNVLKVTEGVAFLGYHIYRGGIKPSSKAKQKLINGIEKLVSAPIRMGESPESLVEECNGVIRGWLNYYSLGNGTAEIRQLERQVMAIIHKGIQKRISSKEPVTKGTLKQLGIIPMYEEFKRAQERNQELHSQTVTRDS